MGSAISHWGIHDECDTCGGYEANRKTMTRRQGGLVLTCAGEILVNRQCIGGLEECSVAIILCRDTPVLTRPQIERIERAFDIAVSVTDGRREAVHLQPVPHHFRFQRADYLTLEEWHEQRPRCEMSQHAPSSHQQGAKPHG